MKSSQLLSTFFWLRHRTAKIFAAKIMSEADFLYTKIHHQIEELVLLQYL